MIISYEGFQGTGKSTAGVANCVDRYKREGRKIITNLHLTGVDYQHFDLAWFIENLFNTELESCVLLLDESYQYMDSRLAQSKITKLFTWFVVQTRKRGVDMYVCTHHIDNIDIRLRRAIDLRGSCRFYPEEPCIACKGLKVDKQGNKCPRCYGYGVGGQVFIRYWNKRKGIRYSSTLWGPEWWGYFDTQERIPIQQKMLQGLDTAEII